MGATIKIESLELLTLRDDCRIITTNSVLILIEHLTSINVMDIKLESMILVNVNNNLYITYEIDSLELQKLNQTKIKTLERATHIIEKGRFINKTNI